MCSLKGEGVGDGDVDGLGVDRPDEFVETAQPREQIGFGPQGGGIEKLRGQRRSHAGVHSEELSESGDEYALVGEALSAESSDQSEDVVDAEVVGEALVGDVVGDKGVAGGADAGKAALELGTVGLAEVVALVVSVAAADGPALGVEDHERVLLVGLESDAGPGVQPEHRANDVV